MYTPEILFERWFTKPLRILERISNGDGGFVALATSLFLYERYVSSVLEQKGTHVYKNSIIKQVAHDFRVDNKTAKAFWDVMRNGLLHQGMPKQLERGKELPMWKFQGSFIVPVKLTNDDNVPVLEVQPWLVMNRVIELWQKNLELIDQNNSFPWADVYLIYVEETRDSNIVTGSSSGLNEFNQEN